MTFPRDPAMLLSVVNTLLRDRYSSLALLCDEEGIARDALETALHAIGYTYIPVLNQFR